MQRVVAVRQTYFTQYSIVSASDVTDTQDTTNMKDSGSLSSSKAHNFHTVYLVVKRKLWFVRYGFELSLLRYKMWQTT
jgi:hypothetical protein